MSERIQVLRARVLLPVTGPPVEDGAVRINGNRIEFAGPFKDLPKRDRDGAFDLGEVILLPGLVNAHCHLDYTHMAGQLTPPANFVDWLKLIVMSKSGWTYSDYADSWLAGAKMLVRHGVTTVGDVEMSPELLPEVWTATPLRVVSMLEMTGVRNRRPVEQILGEAMQKAESLAHGRCRVGLSPHAPYSTTAELLRLSARAARERRMPVTVHVAESQPEFEMFTLGRGAMYDWIAKNGRDMEDCGHGSPVQHLEKQGALGPELLAVHVNHLDRGDAALLGKRKVHVVHCPRSHAYFRRRPFPVDPLKRAGVNICLGTDSLASILQGRREKAELDMFAELRAFASAQPKVSPRTILKMATVNGARALGMAGEIGELRPGTLADLIAIPFEGKPGESWEAVVQFRGELAISMIDGEWAVAPIAA